MRSRLPSAILLAVLVLGPAAVADADSDPQAVQLAERAMQAMGGQEAWDATRFVSWRFFGRRLHTWDRYTGDLRLEDGDNLLLMNLDTRKGRLFQAGEEITDPGARAEALENGYGAWVNDSYWVFMPFKLLDPGVTLTYLGADPTEDGRPAQKVALTFDGVGLTPENRYEVWFDDESGLVTQWAYFPTADAEEPRFIGPWADWRPVGGILLAHNHGRDMDWELRVFADLPRAVFEDPATAVPSVE